MLEIMVGGFILILVGILQSALFSRIVLLNGMADLVMLVLIAWTIQKSSRYVSVWLLMACVISFLLSGLPYLGGPVAYWFITGLAVITRRRFSEVSLLVMLTLAIVGTIIFHAISITILILAGAIVPLDQVLNLVTIPSILLNLLFAIPVYALVRDLANWIYPIEMEL